MPLMIFATFSVMSFYGTAILYRYPNEKWRLWLVPVAMAMGIGLVFSNARAVLEALFKVQSSFVRTPKYNVENRRDNWLKAAMKYRRKKGVLPFIELAFALYFVFAVYYAMRSNIYATIPFLLIFLLGYGYMAVMSLFQGGTRRLLQLLRRN
jgi:xanthine/uracil permease